MAGDMLYLGTCSMLATQTSSKFNHDEDVLCILRSSKSGNLGFTRSQLPLLFVSPCPLVLHRVILGIECRQFNYWADGP